MAPYLVNVNNASGKRVYVYITGGKTFAIENGESESVNSYISADSYTKIDRDVADVHGYLLKYDDYNIMINDPVGINNNVPDNAIHTYRSSNDINIDVYHDQMKIWCTANDLGIYKPDGYPKYYRSILASHEKKGGIFVKGFETVAGERSNVEDEAEKEEAEEEEASAKNKGPHAEGDGPTESTSKTN